jgi:hypothetical protein
LRYRSGAGSTIWSWNGYLPEPTIDLEIDVVFETLADSQPNFIRVFYDGDYDPEDVLFQFSITPISLNDESGVAIPSILNENKVDLKRAVPDMLFGDLVKFILEAKKMDMTLIGREVWINYVDAQIRASNIVDLSAREVKRPKQKFNKGSSYLLKYEDVQSDVYTYAEVFQNNDGYTTNNFTKDEKTVEIPLKGLPLPLLLRNGVQTAHAFLEDKAKPFLVLYDGLTGAGNLTQDPAHWLIPYLHITHHYAWLARQINTYSFRWTFSAWYEEILNLTVKSRVHAYTNIHLVKSIQKTEVRPDLFEIEIETELLK